MDASVITLLLFVSLICVLFMSVPIAFGIGIVSLTFGYFIWGPASIFILASQVFAGMQNPSLVSLPFFMFMAALLVRSGIADDLYDAMYMLIGKFRGGLAIGTIFVCAGIGCMSGVSAVGVLTSTKIALPAMLRRNYDEKMSLGVIMAGGALGQLFPPSVLAIVYGGLSGVSVGKMFAVGLSTGAVMVICLVAYVSIRCWLDKDLCPAASDDTREKTPPKLRMRTYARTLPSILVVLAVLGSMLAGIATPTEAAAIGAAVSAVIALALRTINWKGIFDAAVDAAKQTTMVLWIALNSLLFVSVYSGIGGGDVVHDLIASLGVTPGVVTATMLLIVFFLGFFVDPIGILFLTMPVFLPVLSALNVNLIWVGALTILVLETAYLTPPFGYNIFFLKSAAPASISLRRIYSAAPAFVFMQLMTVVVCFTLPGLVLWIVT
ncbi:TRAP transporter large permease subunit [Roseovarius sp. MMSF_3350]|uniref:TRAP transporter large permease n=1 Tax=Roseovarius sp. MMSF_3350 TaxID=3046706 RepID=UPI00273F2D9E|nr:TRAP transporter large permease subunit [Roseovarius sp. MMSF_3350]